MEQLGRLLIVLGLVILVVGLVLTFSSRLFPLGRLPGDIVIQRGNFTFYFPLMTSIVLSIVLTLLGLLFWRR